MPAIALATGRHRPGLFGGLRIGLYDPVKRLIVGKDHVGDVSLAHKIAAGRTRHTSRGELLSSPLDSSELFNCRPVSVPFAAWCAAARVQRAGRG